MKEDGLFVDTFQNWMGIFMHNSMANLTRYARENGFSMSQLMTLQIIHQHGTCNVSDLGEKIGITNAAVSQLLERLVKQGLISRKEAPHDRRNKVIMLTEKGKKVFYEGLSARSKWLSDLEIQLSETECKETIQVITNLILKAKMISNDNCLNNEKLSEKRNDTTCCD
ncbi:MAG: MarR family transcriptional regulator [Anaerolineaceae bacterium]|nr:MarR family transcriptional regulator [Anaerolineaceae bacterium]